MSDWGQGVVNNTIDWGRGSTNNSISWGSVYANSPSGDTSLEVSTPSFTNEDSINFSGVDKYAECGNVTSLNGSAVASWSFWAKRDDVTNNEVAISQSGAGTDRQFYIRFIGNNRVDAYLNNYIMFRDTSLNVTFANDTWYHIVLTYNGSNTPNSAKCNLYINGGIETNSTGYNETTLDSSTSNFNIGRHQSGASSYNNYFDGNIDEIAFFDKELTQSEVTAIYGGGTPTDLTSHANLTDWWRCGDNNGGSGTTLTAAVGGVNGTLYNSASYEENVPT
jgi:hypothetical protein